MRIMCAVLASILLVSLGACSSTSSTNSKINNSDNLNISRGYQNESYQNSSEAQPVQIPENVMNVYSSFSENESNFEYTVHSEPYLDDIFDYYQFKLSYEENSSSNGTATVIIEKDKKSIKIDFQESSYGNIAPQLIKDAICTAFIATGSSDLAKSKELTNLIVNSYTGNGYSDIIDFDNYKALIVPTDIGHEFHLIFEDEYLKSNFAVENYSEGSIEAISAALNVGERYHLTAKVLNVGIEQIPAKIGSLLCGVLDVVTIDGNKYKIIIRYEKVPIKCKVATTYDFYGFVSEYTKGTPTLWAENCVESQQMK